MLLIQPLIPLFIPTSVIPIHELDALGNAAHMIVGKIRIRIVQRTLIIVGQQIKIHVAPDHRPESETLGNGKHPADMVIHNLKPVLDPVQF